MLHWCHDTCEIKMGVDRPVLAHKGVCLDVDTLRRDRRFLYPGLAS